MRDFGATFDRFGSFSIEQPAASSPVMSAVPPIATEFCAAQQMAVSARTGPEQVQQNLLNQNRSFPGSAREAAKV
jgi:hypothetical protein